MKVQAILVAGGHGTRLLPFTRFTHKTLLPLHRRPVIDYALGTIRRAGVTDITIIGNQFIGQIAQHVGTGLAGENIHYVIEEEPAGVAAALNLARPHATDCRLLVYFSDNITTYELRADVEAFSASLNPPGCMLLAREVEDPSAFGVAVLDEEGRLSDIIEKPASPPSNLAIGGIYLFDERFWNLLDEQTAIHGEAFSISDVNRRYLSEGVATVRTLNEATWIDCGTADSLLIASDMASRGEISPEPCIIRPGDPAPKGP